MQKVVIKKSTRGRSVGIAQNLVFENGIAFVTGAYSSIDWEEKEKLIARLARVWNITADLPDEALAILEAHLTKRAPDVWESTPLQAFSKPENSATPQALSTPPTRG